MNQIDLSIVIVSSQMKYLEDCLKTLYSALKGISNEIIIIDNASVDMIGNK